MAKTIMITGATDGIGLVTAKRLAAEGHTVLMHGRNAAKLEAAAADVQGKTASYLADLSHLSEVAALAKRVQRDYKQLDALINNAGVLKTPSTITSEGLDVRFVVNTFAPYLLTRLLLPMIPKEGRVVNLSSAAQAEVDFDAMAGRVRIDDMAAYSQSKLAITIWSQELAKELAKGPAIIAVNPGSLLASKMVKDAFGVAGHDLQVGADILIRAALDEDFATASGRYFDNDAGRFGQPHSAAKNAAHSAAVMGAVKEAVSTWV